MPRLAQSDLISWKTRRLKPSRHMSKSRNREQVEIGSAPTWNGFREWRYSNYVIRTKRLITARPVVSRHVYHTLPSRSSRWKINIVRPIGHSRYIIHRGGMHPTGAIIAVPFSCWAPICGNQPVSNECAYLMARNNASLITLNWRHVEWSRSHAFSPIVTCEISRKLTGA